MQKAYFHITTERVQTVIIPTPGEIDKSDHLENLLLNVKIEQEQPELTGKPVP